MGYLFPFSKAALDLAVAIITILGFPITIYSIIRSNRNTQRSVDIQIVTSLALTFHQKWEGGWREIVQEAIRHEDQDNYDNKDIIPILNWIDWLGVLIHYNAFSNVKLIFDTIGKSMEEVIYAARYRLNTEGAREWIGVFEIAKKVGLLSAAGQIRRSDEARRQMLERHQLETSLLQASSKTE